MLLEQLAREAGVLRFDGKTPCVPSQAHHTGRLFVRATEADSQCVIRPFGREMATPSFAMYTFSIAVFVQALVLISFSAVADYGNL